jgi:hypothetical protein
MTGKVGHLGQSPNLKYSHRHRSGVAQKMPADQLASASFSFDSKSDVMRKERRYAVFSKASSV